VLSTTILFDKLLLFGAGAATVLHGERKRFNEMMIFKDAMRCERIAWLHGNPVPYQCTIAKLEKMNDSLASKKVPLC
jgi:hypothetical protein